MLRMGFAGACGFILVFIQSYIVMQIKGYYTIDFGGIGPFVSVWAMNFFLLFAIFTEIKNWLEERQAAQEQV